MSTPCQPLLSTFHLTPAGEPTSPLLHLNKRQVPQQAVIPAKLLKDNWNPEGEYGDYKQEWQIKDTASGGWCDDGSESGAYVEAGTENTDQGERKSGGHENEGQWNNSNIDNQTVPLVVTSPVAKQPATFHLNAKAFKKGPSAPSNISYNS